MESTALKRNLPWVVATALFMEQLDSTIVNTAIPAMAASLQVTPLSLKAVVTSYIVSLAVCIPVSGWVADRFGTRRIAGKSFFKVPANQVTQGAEPPQYGGDEPPGQSAISFGQSGQARMGVLTGKQLIERNSPPQNAVEDIGSNSSSSEAGNFRLRGSARTRHTRIVAEKLCPRRERSRKYVCNSQIQVGPRLSLSLAPAFGGLKPLLLPSSCSAGC